MRIAMWSGPRNLSTAMMYSFGARGDCAIWDEPYYAAYLSATGLDHPLREAIISAGEVDPARVASRCIGQIPDGKPVYYQKHMTHHMIKGFDRSWFKDMTHIFLIRAPAKVIASYHLKHEKPGLDDIGFARQAQIFSQVSDLNGRAPVVIDSQDILNNPKDMLQKLCARIGLEFSGNMLKWPAGGHSSDGAWAPHWYGSVWNSTGFAKPKQPSVTLDEHGQQLVAQAQPYYDMLQAHKLS